MLILYDIVWRNFACWVIFYWPAADLADDRGTLGLELRLKITGL